MKETVLKERVVNIHKLKLLSERAKEIIDSGLTINSTEELKTLINEIDNFKPNIDSVGTKVDKFNSLNIDLDKWKFEINGKKIERCNSLTLALTNHCIIANVETYELDENGMPYSMVNVYESTVKPR